MMTNQDVADKIYRKFSNVEGNQHIASAYALRLIIDLVKQNRPKSILEIGMGIGSVSDAIFEYSKQHHIQFQYHGTEANEFCLTQLPLNLGHYFERIVLFPDLDAIPKHNKYDLMIVDGSDSSLEKLKDIAANHAVIFIEGDRAPQEKKIRELFPKHLFCQSVSNFKNPSHGPFNASHWSSGGKIIYVNPTLSQRLSYFLEKVRTNIRYKMRGSKKTQVQ